MVSHVARRYPRLPFNLVAIRPRAALHFLCRSTPPPASSIQLRVPFSAALLVGPSTRLPRTFTNRRIRTGNRGILDFAAAPKDQAEKPSPKTKPKDQEFARFRPLATHSAL